MLALMMVYLSGLGAGEEPHPARFARGPSPTGEGRKVPFSFGAGVCDPGCLWSGLPEAGYEKPEDFLSPSNVGEGEQGGEVSSTRFTYTAKHMGTEWRIVLYAGKKDAADDAVKTAWARVAELEAIMTDYDKNSELMKLCSTNDDKPGEPVKVSEALFTVLQRGQTIAEQSEGAFDMTCGPLVKLWRQTRKTKDLPKAEELAAAKKLVGFKMMKLNAEKKTVTLDKAGMRLDLGGIGKGYAADAAREVLKAKGFPQVLIAASGDITVGDAPPDKEAWIVEIAPIGKGEEPRYVKLKNASVSTSGDLFQYVEIGGVRYSHVLNLQTGLGLTGRRSATVIAKEGWLADALTKAASVLPPEQALKVIETHGGTMYLVVKDTDDAKAKTTASKTFADYEVKE
jgi:FAD:protein FMN transferase